jgi:hypothetical protein
MFHPDPARKLSANLYDIYHCCVYSEKLLTDGQRNGPKHVEFHSKNKFEKSVHLVGFVIKNLLVTLCSRWTRVGRVPFHPVFTIQVLHVVPTHFRKEPTRLLSPLMVAHRVFEPWRFLDLWPSIPMSSCLEWTSTVSFMTDGKDSRCDLYTQSPF